MIERHEQMPVPLLNVIFSRHHLYYCGKPFSRATIADGLKEAYCSEAEIKKAVAFLDGYDVMDLEVGYNPDGVVSITALVRVENESREIIFEVDEEPDSLNIISYEGVEESVEEANRGWLR